VATKVDNNQWKRGSALSLESDFIELVRKSQHVVDKSLFIAEFLEASAGVYIVSRPPKWGKTVNLSMLRYFLAARGSNTAIQGMFMF
jgi:hypothetical protein